MMITMVVVDMEFPFERVPGSTGSEAGQYALR